MQAIITMIADGNCPQWSKGKDLNLVELIELNPAWLCENQSMQLLWCIKFSEIFVITLNYGY